MNGCVIVDTRHVPNIRAIVESHIDFTGWDVTFFVGAFNYAYIMSELKGLNVTFIKTDLYTLNEYGYNILLTSKEFWQQIPYDKVLIFQHDSRLLRKGVEDFLQWDYVGAPWLWQKFGGNGGLSLRTKSVMLEIIKANPYESTMGNEDVYFCNSMHRNVNYKLAPRYVCESFSCEAIFKLETFGYHAIEKWMSKEQCNQIKKQYL